MESSLKKKKQSHHPNRSSAKKRKKGRPSKADLARRYPIRSVQEPDAPRRRTLRPLRRRRGLEDEEPFFYEYDGEDDDDDEEEEEEMERSKREKKLTVVLKLNRKISGGARASDLNSSAASSVEEGVSRNRNKIFKKRRINGGDDDVDDGDEEDDDDADARSNKSNRQKEEKRNGVPESVESVPGLQRDSALPTPLPDMKILEFILHKLQKKDTYGVYAEPVDPEELPDYHEIIEHPMDFGTIRKKLSSGAYTSLEQFESDVFLVCTNAMQYNSPDTIYHKQARAIQEQAKKRFEKLRVAARNEMEQSQKIKSTSVASKSMNKSMCMSANEPLGSDFSSGATLANTGDTCTWPTTTQVVAFDKSGSVDGFATDGHSFLDENKHATAEELSVKGFQSKFGRKLSVVDENRRTTYNTTDQSVTGTETVFATFESEMKQLVVVGLHADHSYARSLARFAAALGPVAWSVASRRIEHALPAGYKYGRGWVGEYEPLQTPILSFENHSWRQQAYNTIFQHKSVSSKVQEVTEKSKFTRDRGPKAVKIGSETPVEAVRNHTPVPSNLDNKLACFGNVAGTSPTVKDARFQKQNLVSMEFTKPGFGVLKQMDMSCLSSVSDIIPCDASQKLEDHSPMMSPRLVEMVSRSRDLMHSVPFEQTQALMALHGTGSEGASQCGNAVRTDGGGVDALQDVRMKNTSGSATATGNLSLPFVFNHEEARALSLFGHSNNEQGLNDPVKVMMLSGKMANQTNSLNSPMDDHSQMSSGRDSSAASAAARAWMSVGAQGLKLTDIRSPQMQIAAASLYNPTRELPSSISQSREDSSGSGRPQSEHRLAGRSLPHPVHVGEDLRFQNSRFTAFCQLPAADLSRFHVDSPWKGLVPHNSHQRGKTEMPPPDLNISFQSSGSPVQQLSSGVQVDSQQPDLALQLRI